MRRKKKILVEHDVTSLYAVVRTARHIQDSQVPMQGGPMVLTKLCKQAKAFVSGSVTLTITRCVHVKTIHLFLLFWMDREGCSQRSKPALLL